MGDIFVLHTSVCLGDHPECVHRMYTGNDTIEYYSSWLTESLATAGEPNSDMPSDWPQVVNILGCVNVILVEIYSKSPIDLKSCFSNAHLGLQVQMQSTSWNQVIASLARLFFRLS